ncbi:unnamed protein product, partial [Symbiodinium sp. CCMP2456]
ALARGVQQLQELQAQALSKGATHTAADSLKAGTNALTPLPDHRGGAEASLKFQDWVEITSTAMTDVSEKSGQWWKAVMLVAEAAYSRWLSATHLERLSVQPEGMGPLCEDPWGRINARACSLLLNAMTPELRADMIAQRITQYAPALMFRCQSMRLLPPVKGYHRHLQAELEGILGAQQSAVPPGTAAVRAVDVSSSIQSPKGNKQKDKSQVLSVKDIRISSMDSSSTALLDSGSTHCLRNAHDMNEWRITLDATTDADLIDYDYKGTYHSSTGRAGCPHLQEAEALSLIARLEDRKREQLENVTVMSQDYLEAARMVFDAPWKDQLTEYVTKGIQEAGLRAVRDAPFLADLPRACVDGLVQSGVMEGGWQVLKEIEFLTRPQRRRLWNAKRLIIHLFAGDPGHYEVFQLDEGDTVVLELDIQRCKAHDILRTSTWRLLMWAAMSGKIDARSEPKMEHVWRYVNYHNPDFLYLGAGAGEGSCARIEALDKASPMRPVAAGLDVTSKGTMGRNLKYLMIARYNLPVEYVKGYTAREPPGDHGLSGEIPVEQDGSADKELGAEPSQKPPHEDGEGKKSREIVFDGSADEELAEPSRLPPHEDGDPFILEPGEQGPLLDEPGEQGPLLDEPGEQGQGTRQSSEDVDFIGGTRRQQAEYQDYDDSMYEPSEPEDPPKEPKEDLIQRPGEPDPHQDCVAPASTYLLFAKALPSNGSAVVKAAMQDVILYLQAHGLPIYRLHADKGETYNHSVRQGKNTTAIFKATNSTLAYGGGRYVGLSSILDNGHVVYIPDEQGTREKFIHTFHVRPRLIDPGLPQQELIVDDPPRPRRRVEGKTPLAYV